MSITYTPTTNFAGKDSLPSNDSNKVVKGAEFTTEFTAIQSAFALAAPSSNPTYTGTATFDDMNVGGDLNVTGSFTSPGIDDNANATAITIDASENVGIGTTSPVFRLSAESASATVADLKSTSANSNLRLTNSGGLAVVSSEANDLVFSSSTSEKMRINTTGNVGIGTESPNQLLTLGSSTAGATIGMDFETGNAPRGSILYNASQGSMDFTSGYAGYGGEFTFTANGSEAMRIDSVGNVGIGTDNPLNKLVVAEDTGQHGIEFAPGTLSYMQAYDRATADYGDLRIDAQTITFGTDIGAERMRIDAVGNVGIGTSNPNLSLGTGLHVKGVDYVGLTLQKGGAGFGHALDFTDENNALQYRIGTNFSSGGQNLLFSYGTNVGMMLDSSGKTTIKSLLNVEPSATPGSAVAGDIYFDSTTNKLRCYDGTIWQDCF